MSKIKIYKTYPGKDLAPCCEKDIKNVIPWLEQCEVGDVLSIEILEMEEDEYNNLPEYMGP